ncbi:allatostatin-A receptor-like [Ptychodera flava]|uniref:allatostatin-A receptor-like n=1 Tax=Ptychodera flava TaxID=63121 RepID=UPI00396A28F9
MTTSEPVELSFFGNATNDTNATSYEDMPTSEIEAAAITVFYGLITIIGFVGNSMVILVVLKEKKMRNTTNVFVFSLSIADLSFIVICVPVTALNHILGTWIFGRAMCKIMTYFTFVNVYASVYTLTVMSFDRFLAIVYPIRTMKFRRTRYAIVCVTVLWTVILSALSPMLIVTDTIQYGNDIVCTSTLDRKSQKWFIGQFFATSYAFPLTVISLTYFFMLRNLWINAAPSANISEESARRKRKVTVMVVAVVVVFAICWLPIQVILIRTHFATYDYRNPTLMAIYYTANCMSYANSCINPIIYVFLSKNYRQAFKRAICCCIRKQQTSRSVYNRDSMMATTAVTSAPNKTNKRYGGGKYMHPENQRNSVSSSSITQSSPKHVHNKRKGNEYLMAEMSRIPGETKPLFGESSASDTGSTPSELPATEDSRPLAPVSQCEGAIKRVARAITRAAFNIYDDSDTSSVGTESVSTTTSSPARKIVDFKLPETERAPSISRTSSPRRTAPPETETETDSGDCRKDEADQIQRHDDASKIAGRTRRLRRNRATFLSYHN